MNVEPSVAHCEQERAMRIKCTGRGELGVQIAVRANVSGDINSILRVLSGDTHAGILVAT